MSIEAKLSALAHAVTVDFTKGADAVLATATKFEAFLTNAAPAKVATKATKAAADTTASTPAAAAAQAATPAVTEAATPVATGPQKKDVVAKVQALIQANLNDQCGEILEKFGSAVRNVSSIPVENYGKFIAAADALLATA